MNELVRHRGPDDEGYVVFRELDQPAVILGGNETAPECYTSNLPYTPKHAMTESEQIVLGMGHRRLSIIDLAVTGHQPMSYSDGRYWIVYNGEIYNYIELKEELVDLGYSFISASDTEVILAAWDCWGEKAPQRFNGMFSFAIYDMKVQTLVLVRDRFGVKPLYYWVSPAGLMAFASEIKQFSVLPGWNPRLNGQMAYEFLIWGLIDHTGETLFNGVFQLRPGTMMRIELREAMAGGHTFQPNRPYRSESWYELKPSVFEGTFEEATIRFRDLLHDAVRLRLRSDVPVGSCLSGGLDSSSLVCMVNRLLKERSAIDLQKSFSARSHEKEFDEGEYIDEVIRATGLDAHFVYPSLENLFPSLKDIIWHQDEPFGSISIYAQWNVFRLASQHAVKVMLDGQGADEYLAGYHTYFAVHQASLLRRFRLVGFLCDVHAASRLHSYTLLSSARDAASLLMTAWQRRLISKIILSSDLEPSWLDMGRLGAEARNPISLNGMKPKSILELSLAQLGSSSIPMLLHWEDRNSMSSSIESRIPFLDYRLVEFGLGLPEEYKLHKGVTKRVLRGAMSGMLPEKIQFRTDKLGFITPEQSWMKKSNPQLFRMGLREAVENSQGILSPSVLTVLEEVIDGKRPFSFLVWRLICFGKWLEHFNISV